MTPEHIKLAKDLVKLPWWRWMPGMLSDEGWRFLTDGSDWQDWHEPGNGVVRTLPQRQHPWKYREPYGGFLPDLTDPATFGCLLALALRQYPNGIKVDQGVKVHHAEVAENGDGYGASYGQGSTPGTALARAILAAEGA